MLVQYISDSCCSNATKQAAWGEKLTVICIIVWSWLDEQVFNFVSVTYWASPLDLNCFQGPSIWWQSSFDATFVHLMPIWATLCQRNAWDQILLSANARRQAHLGWGSGTLATCWSGAVGECWLVRVHKLFALQGRVMLALVRAPDKQVRNRLYVWAFMKKQN